MINFKNATFALVFTSLVSVSTAFAMNNGGGSSGEDDYDPHLHSKLLAEATADRVIKTQARIKEFRKKMENKSDITPEETAQFNRDLTYMNEADLYGTKAEFEANKDRIERNTPGTLESLRHKTTDEINTNFKRNKN